MAQVTLNIDTEFLERMLKEYQESNDAIDAANENDDPVGEISDLFAENDELRLILAEILIDAWEARNSQK